MFFTLTQFSDKLSSVYGPPEEHDRSSSAATAHVRCVVTGWRSAPYVERRWKSGSFCISDIEKGGSVCKSDSGKVVEKQIPPYSWWKAEQVMDGIIYVIDIISWKLRC